MKTKHKEKILGAHRRKRERESERDNLPKIKGKLNTSIFIKNKVI